MSDFLIVGAGVAGHSAAMELAKHGAGGSIVLVGSERWAPYDRPTVSKSLLAGKTGVDEITLPKAAQYELLGIDFRPELSVSAIDRAAKRAMLGDGSTLPFARLLIATGASPRRLTLGEESSGADDFYLRSVGDALRLKPHLQRGRHIGIIGGGLIGLEVASTARELGCEVTIIEQRSSLLSRAMPPRLGAWAHELHVQSGCAIILGGAVRSRTRCNGKTYIDLDDREIAVDVLVVAVGVEPEVGLAEAAGLTVNNGIVVDDSFRTNDPDIFAAGDVASYPDPWIGRLHRSESWRSSMDQGAVAARNMIGQDALYDKLPWLWSDQYGHNIQLLGFPELAQRQLVRAGGGPESWTMIGVDDSSALIGVVAVNNGRDISMFRRLMSEKRELPASLLDEFAEIRS